ncbi:BglG family transcription antiterminator [Aquibacillus sediminis]|uniref:BglG family transcription antiterminator n=1 Tax=Aquibacillus sediminis TaxID=2574734 RepID=UPI001107C523|nr:BglG family transcription antiterminator [Aquibacillus sediminis]
MNFRHKQILRELMSLEETLTSTYLANIVQVTSRTIREDIKALDTFLQTNGAEIKSIRGKGYQLNVYDDQAFRQLLNQEFQKDSSFEQASPSSPEDRVNYLIKRLLLSNGYLKLDGLADEMYISKSTIQNDMKQVKNILKKYDICLEKRPNYGLKVKGSEVKVRFAMSEYIFDRSLNSVNPVINEQLSALMDKKQLNQIWSIILEQIKQNSLTLSDIAINNLFVHIAIGYNRIMNGYHVSLYKKELKDIEDQKEYRVAEKIVDQVEEVLAIKFPKTEIAYIAIHLLGTKMIEQTNMSEEQIEEVIDDGIYQLTFAIMEKIEDKLNLKLKHDHELIIGMALHLKPAINRYRYGMNVRNPMLEDIKANYPLAFEAGIIAGLVLEESVGAAIDENEIGYLALHIGAAIERNKLHARPKRCLIVCASGQGSAQLLKYRIQAKIGEKLQVVDTTEYYKLSQKSFNGIDFIISSIPITIHLPVPVIEVNTILSERDLDKIENFLNGNTNGLLDYIREDLFFPKHNFSSKEEVLKFLAQQLKNKGLVDDNFLKAVYEREELAPTDFGNLVAIPHPITPQTTTTLLAICTLDKPIIWKNKRVQFVCLLCVKKESSEDLQMMYKVLGEIIEDSSLIHQLVKSESYSMFMKHLLRY